MTAFDLEDDDFFAATFNSISDSDLMNVPSSSKLLQNNSHDPKNAFLEAEIDNFLSTTTSEETSKFNFSKKPDSKILFEKLNTTENPESIFIPKAKKRKFPGPAGIFTQEPKAEKTIYSDIDDCNQITEPTQSLSSSQPFVDDLLHPSWTKLRSVLSSTSNSLLSVAKHHNIAKVLLETSKRRLPKHLVVPLLCVLVKKFNSDESHSVFVDDTGEVIGKIDKEVVDKLKDSLQDGISLVLEKVTFLCNVLMLRKQNIVSMYFDDGTVRHLKDISLSSTLNDLSSMTNFQSPSTPKGLTAKSSSSTGLASGTSPVFSKIARTSCSSSPRDFIPMSASRNSFEGSPILNSVADKTPSSQRADAPVAVKSRIPQCNKTPNSFVPSSSGLQRVPNKLKTLPFLAKNSQSSVFQEDKSASHSNVQKEISPVKKVQINDVEGDFEKDDFDELLLNLDESSFMDV